MLHKKQSSANNQYQNIPSTGFSSCDEQVSTQQVWVKNKIKGYLTLSLFAVMQLIEGVKGHISNADSDTVSKRIVELMSKLFSYGLNVYPLEGYAEEVVKKTSNIPTIELTRDEVKLLKMFLESRMAHCEQERDTRAMRDNGQGTKVECFNADTYIAQKMLLIELREWLLGEETEQPEYAEVSAYPNFDNH